MGVLPGSTSNGAPDPGFAPPLTRRLRRLREACDAALDPFWEEPWREDAYLQADTLGQLCRSCGLTDIGRLARGLASLLRLPLEEVATMEPEVRERVREILALLDDAASADRRTA